MARIFTDLIWFTKVFFFVHCSKLRKNAKKPNIHIPEVTMKHRKHKWPANPRRSYMVLERTPYDKTSKPSKNIIRPWP